MRQGVARIIPVWLLVLVVAFGGCASTRPDLPTISGHPRSTSPALAVVAKSYFDCMTDAGLSANLYPNSQGQLAVVQIDGNIVLIRSADGSLNGSGNAPIDELTKLLAEFQSNNDTQPALIVDGIDYSEEYARCLATSGYDENTAQGLDQYNDLLIRLQVEANNRWAACARENGWPMLEDSTMPTSPSESPTVTLPSSITEDQLRTLLSACPNFNREQQEKMQAWEKSPGAKTTIPADYLPDPNLTFNIPNSTSPDPNLDILYAILSEQYDGYYGGLGENDGTTTTSANPAHFRS